MTGIITCHGDRLHTHKGEGKVAEVFTQQNITNLRGNIGIGHVRYPTAGRSNDINEVQPFYTNFPFGIALAHNGNLTNTTELTQRMQAMHRHVNTSSDSEALLNIFADELQRRQISEL